MRHSGPLLPLPSLPLPSLQVPSLQVPSLQVPQLQLPSPSLPALLLFPVLLVLAGCPNLPAEVCGLSTSRPEGLSDGRGSATRSDGEDFSNEDASWSPEGGSDSVTIGDLDMIIAQEETGLDTEQLIADGAFPICVPLGERSGQSGSANLVSTGMVSDASHEGGVAILGEEGGFLIGRFEVEVANASSTISFTDGVFKARLR